MCLRKPGVPAVRKQQQPGATPPGSPLRLRPRVGPAAAADCGSHRRHQSGPGRCATTAFASADCFQRQQAVSAAAAAGPLQVLAAAAGGLRRAAAEGRPAPARAHQVPAWRRCLRLRPGASPTAFSRERRVTGAAAPQRRGPGRRRSERRRRAVRPLREDARKQAGLRTALPSRRVPVANERWRPTAALGPAPPPDRLSVPERVQPLPTMRELQLPSAEASLALRGTRDQGPLATRQARLRSLGRHHGSAASTVTCIAARHGALRGRRLGTTSEEKKRKQAPPGLKHSTDRRATRRTTGLQRRPLFSARCCRTVCRTLSKRRLWRPTSRSEITDSYAFCLRSPCRTRRWRHSHWNENTRSVK